MIRHPPSSPPFPSPTLSRSAIGAPEHRARSVHLVNPAQLASCTVERLVPGNRHEFIAASPIIRLRAALQPAAPDHRPGDPRPVDRKSTRLNSSHSQISYAVF